MLSHLVIHFTIEFQTGSVYPEMFKMKLIIQKMESYPNPNYCKQN